MSEEKCEFVFLGDMRLIRRKIVEDEVSLAPGAMERMTSSAPRRIWRVMKIKDEMASICLAPNNLNYITLPVHTLALKSRYSVVDKRVVLNLTGEVDAVNFKWIVPTGMRVSMLFQAKPQEDGYTMVDRIWLFAMTGSSQATYRLPLGNLYDDCAICSGRDRYMGATVQDAVKAALDQVENSEWNSDLWRTTVETQKMFRFTPTKDGFQQNASEETWTSLSRKVSVAASGFITI